MTEYTYSVGLVSLFATYPVTRPRSQTGQYILLSVLPAGTIQEKPGCDTNQQSPAIFNRATMIYQDGFSSLQCVSYQLQVSRALCCRNIIC